VIVLNQPMNSTRLRGVAPEKQAAVTEAVKVLVASVNGQSTNEQTSSSDAQSESKSSKNRSSMRTSTAESNLKLPPSPRVTASVVDFARVVSESALDPGAPPDAALPVLEDDLHFGFVTLSIVCPLLRHQFLVLSKMRLEKCPLILFSLDGSNVISGMNATCATGACLGASGKGAWPSRGVP